MIGELRRWTVGDLARAIQTRAVSAREAVGASADRTPAVNPRLNAVTVELGDQALVAAEAVDRAIARGEAVGPLAGVPVTIKQNGPRFREDLCLDAAMVIEARPPVLTPTEPAL